MAVVKLGKHENGMVRTVRNKQKAERKAFKKVSSEFFKQSAEVGLRRRRMTRDQRFRAKIKSSSTVIR